MPAPKGHLPYNKNGEGGRPKRYTELYIDELANHLEEWIDLDKENIFIEDWCLENDIPEETISTDLIKNDRFSKAYNKFKTKQKVSLCKGSLRRKFAHPMCALLLSHSHGIHLKTEQKVTANVGKTVADIINEGDGLTKDLIND